MRTGPIRKPRRKLSAPKGWFGRLGKHGFSIATSQRTLAALEQETVLAEFRKLVLFPGELSALEIGAGLNPLAHNVKFHSVTFLEADQAPQAQATLNILKTYPRAENTHVVNGKLQDFAKASAAGRMPAEVPKNFDVCIINEVFTHIPPRERAKALEDLAAHSKKFFIVDRYATIYPGAKSGPVYQGTLVDYRPLQAALERKGFLAKVALKEVGWSPDKYFMLSAIKIPPK